MRSALLVLPIASIAFGLTQDRARIPSQRTPLAAGTFAITGVTLIPMVGETVVDRAIVVVQDGRIAAAGPASRVTVPDGARRIDGTGKYLVPGLVDMHAHLFSDDEVPDSLARYELGVMVANGITATRLMMGTPEQLALREEVAAGRVLGPQLWLASPEVAGRKYHPGFRGHPAGTPDEARAAVRAAKAAGYDVVKLTLFITPEVYDAMVDEAGKQGIGLAGHVDPSVGVSRALAAGQQIEHLDNYLENVLADSAPMKSSVSDRGVYQLEAWKSLDYVDDRKVERIAGATARAGVWVTPTLTIFKTAFGLGQTEAEIKARPDWKLYPSHLRSIWLTVRDKYWANPAEERLRLRWVAVRNRLTKAIVDSGGRILAGSDAPEQLFAYGWTLHRELESLVAAGLRPHQALAAATRNPAEYLGQAREWGTIEVGKRADLVLLEADPLRDIRATRRIAAVAVGGRWLPRAELDRMIAAATERLGTATSSEPR